MVEHDQQPTTAQTEPVPKKIAKIQSLVRSDFGTTSVFLISFVESLLPLPILTEPFLVAAILMDRTRAFRFVFLTTLGSVFGGVLAYIVAAYFKDALFSLLSDDIVSTIHSFVFEGADTFVLTIIGAITPVPYTVVAWAVALSGGNLLIFILASIIGRGIRYSIVGWCTYTFGPMALRYARRSILFTSLIIFVLVAVYVWLKM